MTGRGSKRERERERERERRAGESYVEKGLSCFLCVVLSVWVTFNGFV